MATSKVAVKGIIRNTAVKRYYGPFFVSSMRSASICSANFVKAKLSAARKRPILSKRSKIICPVVYIKCYFEPMVNF